MNRGAILILCLAAAGCSRTGTPEAIEEYYGTLEPFAAEAVYFVLTDRFVDGDADNNQSGQGGGEATRTFDRPVVDDEGRRGNIGYLGGDFKGLLDNAGYVRDMGFTAVWISPIVENPDEAFTGGHGIGEGMFADRGKTGYHGYWGVNFFEVDEHLVSPGLGFADLTRRLEEQHGLKTVLDIVCNHGSPSFTMRVDQPMFGEIYDRYGQLIADHQNLHPRELDPDEPLHAFFHREPDLAELSNIDDTNPDVLDYFADAYLQWIEQGVAAFRVDTIRHMPHRYWRAFSERIRAQHPGFFMFGESFDYEASRIAQHTWPENGGISVLDFPGRLRINEVFTDPDSDFAAITDYLHLTDGIYENPYELMTFYDNHDMPRMNATPEGFIDAHNWLFTSRGIPVVYYGSEMAFRAGRPEHGGNRDYFGAENVAVAAAHPVRAALAEVAKLRRNSPALQRGLQANLDFSGHAAAFFRVYQRNELQQTALVLLNKGPQGTSVTIDHWLSTGAWTDAMSGEVHEVADPDASLSLDVPAHGVRVLLFDAPNNNAELGEELRRLQVGARRPVR
ncbi:MAG: alpha-amylase family glycosyl hydrolase [Woeseiaceae bacterium]